MNETLDVIQKRRSIRSYNKKSISENEKNKIIKAAMRSPTAGNMMLYSILEIDEQDIKEKLVKSCDNQPFIARSPFVLLFLADYQRWMDYFTACNVKSIPGIKNITNRTPQEGDLMLACCDALIAAQTAVIAAESIGIGSCYIGDIMENFEFHKELFDLPKYTFPVTMLCFGYPTKKALERKYTDRLDQKYVHFNNKYIRLSINELKSMYQSRELKHYTGDVSNFGQYMYAKKYVSDFSEEMTRSVKVALKDWSK